MMRAWRVAGIATLLLAWGGSLQAQRPLEVKRGDFESTRGYVSSDRCRSCHTEQYASWHASYHRTMTQSVTPETVLADFDGVTLITVEGSWRLSAGKDGKFWARSPEGRRFEVVQSTGSHHFQLYWYPTGRGNELQLLPFAWINEQSRWAPRRSVFLMPPEEQQAVPVWNYQCLPCHSTVGNPRFQPREGRPAEPASRTVELGIACEACHGPGEAHLVEVDGRRSPMVHPKKLPARRSAQVCGQCHSVNVPYTPQDWADWLLDGPRYQAGGKLEDSRHVVSRETVDRSSLLAGWLGSNERSLDEWFWSDGEARVTGREYNGLATSPCFAGGEFSCLNCHSPHAAEPDDLLVVERDGDGACLQCHETELATAAHTHHPAESAGARCLNCHMPNTTYGLLKMTRSHRVSSPGVESDLDAGRPNACNLCHLDKPLGWTAGRLGEWFERPQPALTQEQETVAAATMGVLTGDAGERAAWAWHLGWEPALEASGSDWQAAVLAPILEDPYDAVRYIAGRSLRGLPGYADFRYDFLEPSGARARANRQWSSPESADILLGLDSIDALLARRNDRPVNLAE